MEATVACSRGEVMAPARDLGQSPSPLLHGPDPCPGVRGAGEVVGDEGRRILTLPPVEVVKI